MKREGKRKKEIDRETKIPKKETSNRDSEREIEEIGKKRIKRQYRKRKIYMQRKKINKCIKRKKGRKTDK